MVQKGDGLSTLSIKSTELQNHVWILPSVASKTAGGENTQNTRKDKDVQDNGVMQVKFSPMAKISKTIITGRNEENVNLQKQKHTCQLMTHIHKDSSLNHTPKMLTESIL